MTDTTKTDTWLNVSLPSEMKQTIEEAAAALGQTASEFALSAAIREARHVLEEVHVTKLSNRDRDRFLQALNAVDSAPPSALRDAAQRYGRRRG